ncbi:MAG: hypothetical protein KatS3mg063_1517 [Tepidiforma sp.]|uniref:hypothetical protein n=1 Tax=Tepidiforma sp. TaxID=2682230 RepID=UPI0021DDB5B8|nr:hypothetical protein [Tepidiforma sp.]GIW15664.1 MAG: hypothetical protein KatS3mg063_1517 [Tepidiforma sp.]
MIARRGRPISTQGLLEEAKVQALALRHELEPHDQWEAAALEVAEILIAEERLDEARRLIRMLIVRDRWENQRHAEIDQVWRELA